MTEPEFDGDALDAGSWIAVADEHFLAAEALADCLRSSGSAASIRARGHAGRLGMMRGCMLLLALAVENALKSSIVRQGKLSISKGGALEWPKSPGLKTTHELVPLAALAAVQLSKEESTLLERLSEYSIWAGKYFTPKKRSQLTHEVRARKNLTLPDDFETARTLINRLRTP